MSELSLVLVLVVRMNSGHRDSQRGSDTSRGALGLIWRALYPGGFVPQMGLYPRYVCTVGGFVAQMGLYLKWVCSPAVFVPGWFYTPRVFVPRWICTQFAPLGFGCPHGLSEVLRVPAGAVRPGTPPQGEATLG